MTLHFDEVSASKPGLAVVVRCWHAAIVRKGAETERRLRHACSACCYSTSLPLTPARADGLRQHSKRGLRDWAECNPGTPQSMCLHPQSLYCGCAHSLPLARAYRELVPPRGGV